MLGHMVHIWFFFLLKNLNAHTMQTVGQKGVSGDCMFGSRLEAVCVGAAMGIVLLSWMKVPAEKVELRR